MLLEKIKNNRKIILIILAIIILVIIDQVAKALVVGQEKNIINENIKIVKMDSYNGAFGMGQNDTVTFVIANIVVIGIILKFMKTQESQIDKKTYIALTFIIAGAIGNLIDKIFKGYVVKCISIYSIPFNIADVLMIVGWVLLALFFAIHTIKLKNKKEDKIE